MKRRAAWVTARHHMIDATPVIGRATVVRAAIWRLGEGIGLEVFSFIFFLALGRLLAPDAFGVVAIAGTFIQACQVILRGGFGGAIRQRAELTSEHLTAAFWANTALGALCALLLVAIAWPLSLAQGKPELLPVLIALTPVLLVSGASWVYNAYLKRQMRYEVPAYCSYISIVAGGMVGVTMALAGAGVWSLVGQQVVGAVVSLVMLVINTPWRPGFAISFRHLRDLASMAGKITAGESLDFLSQRLVVVILGFILSAHAIGLYFLASRLTMTVGTITFTVVHDLTLGVLPRLDVRSHAFREAAYKTLQFTTLFSLPSFIGLALAAQPAVHLMFGRAWAESAAPLQAICVFGTAYAFMLTGRQILVAAGHAGGSVVVAAVNAALCLVAMTLAAPAGITAAAAAGGLANAFCVPVVIRMLHRTLGLSIRRVITDQIPVWVATGIMAVCVVSVGRLDGVLQFEASPAAALLIKAVVGCAAFAVALRVLAPDLFRAVLHLRGLPTGDAATP